LKKITFFSNKRLSFLILKQQKIFHF